MCMLLIALTFLVNTVLIKSKKKNKGVGEGGQGGGGGGHEPPPPPTFKSGGHKWVCAPPPLLGRENVLISPFAHILW